MYQGLRFPGEIEDGSYQVSEQKDFFPKTKLGFNCQEAVGHIQDISIDILIK